MNARVVIQAVDFNVSQVLDQLRAGDLRVGAICSFVGTVRDTRMLSGNAADQILSMELEHYPGMTESAIGFEDAGDLIYESREIWIAVRRLDVNDHVKGVIRER